MRTPACVQVGEQSAEEAARFASYHCQTRSLRLRPWKSPPVWIRDIAVELESTIPSRARAAELLQRMGALGISKYHPSPIEAIAAAEGAGATSSIK